MPVKAVAEDAFDKISLHDDRLWGIEFLVDAENFHSDLRLDIDHICEWIKEEKDESYRWKVAPADLIFHGVTGLKLAIDWKDANYQCAVPGPYILDLKRTRQQHQLVHFDRPYYVWEFVFSDDSFLTFGAWGFDLTLRKPPVIHGLQELSLSERKT